MPWAPDESGQWQWYASPLLAPQAGQQPGQQSWNQDPTGTGPAQGDPTQANYGQPITTHYNPMLSATGDAATALAQRLGGTVVSAPMREAGGGTPGSTFSMPNAQYIQFPNGTIENAGQLLQWAGQYGEDSQQFKTMVQQTQSHLDQVNPTEQSWWQGQGAAAPATQAAPGGGAGATAGQTWYQDPTTSTWKFGAPPPGAVTTTQGTNPTLGQGGPGATLPAQSSGAAVAGATMRGDGRVPLSGGADPGATAQLTPGTSYEGVRNSGGYGIGETGGMSGGTGAIGSQWGLDPTNDPKSILANDRKYAYTQGQNLIANYGDSMSAQDQRARSLGGVGDDLYSYMLAHPGYTPEQAKATMNQEGLDKLDWTDQMAKDNQYTDAETAGIQGDPNTALHNYNGNVEGLRGDARNFTQGQKDIYDTGATDLNTAAGKESGALDSSIDASKLGLSDTYTTQHQFGPEDQQALIEDAGRTVGQGTAAVTDQLQRQANAAGTNAPLAMSAALDRQRQTGAVASADAMTKAKIQAAQLGLTTGQQTETTRLGAEQDISGRRMDAAKTIGAQDAANQQFLTAGRASSGLTTGAAGLAESNRIAEQQSSLAGAGELLAQQRAQALAQNRTQTNQANQAAQFTRGSYQDQAESQRATQAATATRNDLTSARQDVRNEEQMGYNESNSRMAGQLQAFGATTGAGQSSQQNAITAAQMPSTIQKIVGGLTSYASGGVATEPTMARLGELGPEIVIKLKPSKPMSYQRRGEMANAA